MEKESHACAALEDWQFLHVSCRQSPFRLPLDSTTRAKEEINGWTTRTPEQVKLALSPSFPTSGNTSLEITAPAYREGLDRWQSFETLPTVTNWSGNDRLMLDITNPCAERFFFALHIYGAEPNAKPFQYELKLPARGLRRFFVPLTALPGHIKLPAITKIHFFGQDPLVQFRVYLDNLMLLAPGEAPPLLPAALLPSLCELRARISMPQSRCSSPRARRLATLAEGSPARAYARARSMRWPRG